MNDLHRTLRLPLWAVLLFAVVLVGVSVLVYLTHIRLGYPVPLKPGESYDISNQRLVCVGSPVDQDEGSLVFMRSQDFRPRFYRLPLTLSRRLSIMTLASFIYIIVTLI